MTEGQPLIENRMTRRRFVLALAASAGAAGLGACGMNAPSPEPSAVAATKVPGQAGEDRPTKVPVGGADTDPTKVPSGGINMPEATVAPTDATVAPDAEAAQTPEATTTPEAIEAHLGIPDGYAWQSQSADGSIIFRTEVIIDEDRTFDYDHPELKDKLGTIAQATNDVLARLASDLSLSETGLTPGQRDFLDEHMRVFRFGNHQDAVANDDTIAVEPQDYNLNPGEHGNVTTDTVAAVPLNAEAYAGKDSVVFSSTDNPYQEGDKQYDQLNAFNSLGLAAIRTSVFIGKDETQRKWIEKEIRKGASLGEALRLVTANYALVMAEAMDNGGFPDPQYAQHVEYVAGDLMKEYERRSPAPTPTS